MATDEHGHPPHARRTRASDADRDAVLGVLGDAHAAGRLDAEELDERQQSAMEARHLDELPALIDDLPEGDDLAERLRTEGGMRTGTTASGAGLDRRRRPITPAKPGSGEPVWDVAVLSGSTKMIPAGTPKVDGFAFMGGSDIFLHDVLGPGVELTISTVAVWAGHDIFVPGGVRVIDKTVNFLAGNDIAPNAAGDGSNGTLILTGFNLMAGHDIKLDPNWKPDAD